MRLGNCGERGFWNSKKKKPKIECVIPASGIWSTWWRHVITVRGTRWTSWRFLEWKSLILQSMLCHTDLLDRLTKNNSANKHQDESNFEGMSNCDPSSTPRKERIGNHLWISIVYLNCCDAAIICSMIWRRNESK